MARDHVGGGECRPGRCGGTNGGFRTAGKPQVGDAPLDPDRAQDHQRGVSVVRNGMHGTATEHQRGLRRGETRTCESQGGKRGGRDSPQTEQTTGTREKEGEPQTEERTETNRERARQKEEHNNSQQTNQNAVSRIVRLAWPAMPGRGVQRFLEQSTLQIRGLRLPAPTQTHRSGENVYRKQHRKKEKVQKETSGGSVSRETEETAAEEIRRRNRKQLAKRQ